MYKKKNQSQTFKRKRNQKIAMYVIYMFVILDQFLTCSISNATPPPPPKDIKQLIHYVF